MHDRPGGGGYARGTCDVPEAEHSFDRKPNYDWFNSGMDRVSALHLGDGMPADAWFAGDGWALA